VAVLADPVFGPDDPRVPGAVRRRQPDPAMGALLRSAAESGLADLQRLRFSRVEAEAISRLASGRVRLFVDFAASREAVASGEVAGARVVHFATHGLLNSKNPELTGLVLSMVDSNGAPRDGFLRLPDLHRLRLEADLVVLSACQTALGKEVRGEGIVGLTRGFMLSGAPRVVASLWRVHDQGTAEQMKRFYAAMLGQGLPPAAALRQAQRSLAADPRWRSPYYWAAFTLHGNWH
jgi:CHAT domain-containing protein